MAVACHVAAKIAQIPADAPSFPLISDSECVQQPEAARTHARDGDPGRSMDQWFGGMGMDTRGRTYRLVRGATAIMPAPAIGLTGVVVTRAPLGISSLQMPPGPGSQLKLPLP